MLIREGGFQSSTSVEIGTTVKLFYAWTYQVSGSVRLKWVKKGLTLDQQHGLRYA